jgi:hypothetical protein
MKNRQVSIHNVLVAHQQNQMIRRAILASGRGKDFGRMRKVYSMIVGDCRAKTASTGTMNDAMDQLDNPEVKNAVGLGYLTEIVNKFKGKLKGINKGEIDLVAGVLKSKGLTKKLHTLVNAGVRPKTEYERLIANRLQKVGDFSSTLKMMGLLISARTPKQVAKVADVGVEELRDMMGIDKKDVTLTNWAVTKFSDLNQYVAGLPDTQLIVVKVGITILKTAAIALLMKTALVTVGLGVVKVVAFVLLICLITDTQATAQILRKLGVSLATVGVGVIKDLTKGFKFLKNVGQKLWQGGKSLYKKIFRRAAIQQIQQMLRSNTRFRRDYSYAQLSG